MNAVRPLILLIVLAVCGAANPIVYSQPTFWSGVNGAASGFPLISASEPNSISSNYDNFTLSASAAITQVSWYGVYETVQNGFLTNGTPNTASWTIGFNADNTASPGAPVAIIALTTAQVTSTFVGTALDSTILCCVNPGPHSVDVYQFTANIPAVTLTGGVQYWLAITSVQTAVSQNFFYELQGKGGDSKSFLISTQFGGPQNLQTVPYDAAFSLVSAPEPATWALFALGAALIARLRRVKTVNH